MFLMYTVKVVVDGPPGQKVSAQRTDKDRGSGRIVGSAPLQTTLSVAMGYLQGLHLAKVCPLIIPLCFNIQYCIFTCNVFKHFSVFACLQCYSLYAPELLQQDKYYTHGWYLECYNHGSITYH